MHGQDSPNAGKSDSGNREFLNCGNQPSSNSYGNENIYDF